MENKFKFLTKNSLLKKLKNKWFLVANIIVFIVVVGLVNIDSIVKVFGGDFDSDIKIKIVDNTGYYKDIKQNIEEIVNSVSDSKVKIKKIKDEEKAKKDLKDTKDILIVINSDDKNIFSTEFISDSYVDVLRYQTIISGLNNAKTKIALDESTIDKEELAKISTPVLVKRSFISDDKSVDEENSKSILLALSLIIVLPCFMLIIFLVQMIGAEINEEKSTRGMEIIIGNVSAKTHFFSKVLASNIFVLLQGVLLLLYSGIGILIRKVTTPKASSLITNVTSSFDTASVINTVTKSGILEKLGYLIPLIIILIILSFLAYSLLSGILASMTTNMENYQQLQTPLMVISVIGYYLIILSTAFPGASFIKILSCVPLISISLAPGLVLSGQIGATTLIIAILVLVFLNYILIKYGLKIYKVGILNYSETDLWKKIFKAVKEK